MFSLPFFKPTPDSLVRKMKDLPPAPKVLHKLQQLIASSSSDMRQIAELVTLEPGLAARVVKIANSTQFGRGTPVSSIMEAIQRVGLKGVHELVSFAVASQLVGSPLQSYKLDANAQWFRAVACALAAASIAENTEVDRSEAYTAGLMHGLGLMVIDKHISQQSNPKVFQSSGYPLDYSPDETARLGFDHAEVGAALLAYWDFPEAVVTAVRYQIDPTKAPAHRKLCMILATSRWARSLFCVPEENIPELPNEQWMEESGMQIANFGPWLAKIRQGYNIAKVELRLS